MVGGRALQAAIVSSRILSALFRWALEPEGHNKPDPVAGGTGYPGDVLPHGDG